VTLLAVADLVDTAAPGWAALDAADAIIFGAPTYMGSASAPFKAFMDATSSR
jgi:NAD(P)H dehydrogenase (quinone)